MSKENTHNLISFDEVVSLARLKGVNFGKGDPYNRLRYYIKIGLLPRATRKSFNGLPPAGALPIDAVDQIVEIDKKIRDGKSIQTIIREKKFGSVDEEKPIIVDVVNPPLLASIPAAETENMVLSAEQGSFQESSQDLFENTPSNSSEAFQFIKPPSFEIVNPKRVINKLNSLHPLALTGLNATAGVALFLVILLGTITLVHQKDTKTTSSTVDGSSLTSITAPGEVLASTIEDGLLTVNVNTNISGLLTASGGIVTENTDIDAGTGRLTASNVIYSINAGPNVTITPGQNPTISVDAVAANISGTSNRITVNNNVVDIASNYSGQGSITTVGTITSGTWAAGTITDSFISDTLTINSSGSVDWAALTNYPAACGPTEFIRAVGDSLTCATDQTGAGSPITVSDGVNPAFLADDVSFINDFDVDNPAANQAEIELNATGVTAASYGSASSVATFTVDAKGRLTAAGSSAIVINANQITAGTLSLARGGTGADLSATGGANQFVRQNSSGGAFTVSAILDADIPDTITVSNYLPLSGGTITGNLSVQGTTTLGDGSGTDTIILQSTSGNITINNGAGNLVLSQFTNAGTGCSALETNGSGNLVCGVDNTGAASLQDAYDGGGSATINTTNNRSITINLTDQSTDPGLNISTASGATGFTTLSRADGGSTNPAQLLLIDNLDTDTALPIGLKIQGTFTVSTAIDLTDAEIGTALALGGNDVTVGGATISSTEFALLDGRNGALVDTDDAVAITITGTGALNAGSITSGFGAIDVGVDGITGGAITGSSFVRGSDTITDFTGDGLEVSSNALRIRLDTTPVDGSSLTSVSGLELVGGELSLLRGCASGGVLKWDEANFEWDCGTDNTGAGAASVHLGEDTVITANLSVLEFAADVFNVIDSPAGEANVTFRLATAGGAATANFSGLQAIAGGSGGLSLLSCSDTQILKKTSGNWTCSADVGSGGGGSGQNLQDTYDIGATIETAGNIPILITETTAASNTGDLLQLTTNVATGGTHSGDLLQLTLDAADANGFTGHGIHMIIDQSQTSGNAILIEDDQGSPVTLFQLNDNGGLTLGAASAETTAITITDSDYTNALSIADNNITGTTYSIIGTTATIDFTNFDVSSLGVITLAGGQTADLTSAGNANLTITAAGTGDLRLVSDSDTDIVLPGSEFTNGGSGCTSLETDGSGILSCGTDDVGTSNLQSEYEAGNLITLETAEGDLIVNLGDDVANNILIDASANSTTYNDGILFATTGTSSAITDAIDASDADIVNAINIGSNNILTAGATISSIELDVLDGGIDESEVSGVITDVTAGNGLTGGGSSGNVTLDVGAGNGITVNANDIAVNQSFNFNWTGTHSWTSTLTDTGVVQNIDLTLGDDGDVDTIIGLNVEVTSANTGNADLIYGINLANVNSPDGTVLERAIRIGSGWDEVIDNNGTLISAAELNVLDGGITEGEVSGVITDVTAGNGLTGGGSSGNVTLDVGAGNGIIVNANDIAVNQDFAFTWTTDHNYDFTGGENLSIVSNLVGSSVDLFTIGAAPSATSATTRGIVIRQLDSVETNGLDTAILIDNADTNLAFTTGIQFTSSGGGFTNFLDTPSIDITGAGAITGATGVSSSGTITFSAFANNNNSVLYTGASGVLNVAETTGTGNCLLSNGAGAAPSWQSCGAGSAGQTYTDGVTPIAGATQLTFQNFFTVGGSSPNATVTITDDILDFAQFQDTLDLDGNLILNQVASTWTQNYTPAGTTATATGVAYVPTFGIDAANQTLTGISIAPNTNGNTDSGDILYGLSLANITGTDASETAINIGTGWDNALTIAGQSKIRAGANAGIGLYYLINGYSANDVYTDINLGTINGDAGGAISYLTGTWSPDNNTSNGYFGSIVDPTFEPSGGTSYSRFTALAAIANTARRSGTTLTDSVGIETGVTAVGAQLGTLTNSIGLRVLTNGVTSTNAYGIYIQNQNSASTNDYGLYIVDADTGSIVLASNDGDAASGITFGTTNPANLYRSAADTLRTNDNLTVDLDLIVSGGDITGLTSTAIDLGEAITNSISLSGTATGTSATFLGLPVKTDSGDPTTTQTNGAIYYNSNSHKFRCYENSAWKDCDTNSGATATLQNVYDNGSAGDQVITLDGTQDSIIIRNPSATAGTDSAFTFQVDNIDTGLTTANFRNLYSTSAGTFDTTGSSLTNYAGYFNNTSTESAGSNTLTNVGLYASASGGDLNYAAIFENGSVGIGTTAPGALLDIDRPNISSNTEQITFRSDALTQTLSSNLTNARFNQFISPTLAGTAGGATETVTNAATVQISGAPNANANSAITTSAALRIDTLVLHSNVVSGFGLYVVAPTGATTRNAAAWFESPSGVSETVLIKNNGSNTDQFLTLKNSANATVAFWDFFGIANLSGAETAPSYSFSADPETGFYLNTTDVIGVVTNGAERFTIGSSGINLDDDYYIGLGSGAGRFVFDSTPSPDTVSLNDARLVLTDIGGTAGTALLCRNASNEVATCAAGSVTTTLQNAYQNDVDGSDTIIALSIADDSLIFRNPSSLGTDSTFLLSLDQLATGAVDVARISQAGTGTGVSFTFSNAGTVADGILFNNPTGTLTDAIDASAANITNALNIGANDIVGTTGTIAFTNFGVTSIGAGTFASTLAVNGNALTTSSASFTLLAGATTTLNIGPTGANGSIVLAGGSGDTGCTLNGTNGNLACTGNITSSATTGTNGWWTRVNPGGGNPTYLRPATLTDSIWSTGHVSLGPTSGAPSHVDVLSIVDDDTTSTAIRNGISINLTGLGASIGANSANFRAINSRIDYNAQNGAFTGVLTGVYSETATDDLTSVGLGTTVPWARQFEAAFTHVSTFGSPGTVTNNAGLYVRNPSLDISTPITMTNNYGVYIENLTRGTNDYGIFLEGADTADIFFQTDRNHIIKVQNQDTAATAGNNLSILGADGNTSGDGGSINLTAGNSPSGTAGGNITLTGGSVTNGALGGKITLQGGAATSGNAGGIELFGGNSTTTNGDGGHITITAGKGFNSGAAGIVTITGGIAGGNVTPGSVNLVGGTADGGTTGIVGGAVNITGGAGVTHGGGSGVGGAVNITGGAGGTAGGGTISGGAIVITSGAAGAGSGASSGNITITTAGAASKSSGNITISTGVNATATSAGDITIQPGTINGGFNNDGHLHLITNGDGTINFTSQRNSDDTSAGFEFQANSLSTGEGFYLYNIGGASNGIVSGGALANFDATYSGGSGTGTNFQLTTNDNTTGTGGFNIIDIEGFTSSASSGAKNALNIGNLTAGTSSTETAVNIGTGWDIGLNLAGTSTNNITVKAIQASGYTFSQTGSQTHTLVDLAYTFSPTSAGGSSPISNGILIAPTINSPTGAATKGLHGINVAPVFTSCATGACIVSGLTVSSVTDGTGFHSSAITLNSGWDNSILANGVTLDLVSNVTSGAAVAVNSGFAVSLAGAYTGFEVDLNTNYTPGSNNRTGINIASVTGGGSSENALRIGTGWDNDILFLTDDTHIIRVQDQDTPGTAGSPLQIIGAAGNTSGVGGAFTFTSGAGAINGGSGSNSGAFTLQTGAPGSATNGTGGTSGAITIQTANGGAASSAGSGGSGGAIAITSGSGGGNSGGGLTLGGNGGAISITTGTGGSHTAWHAGHGGAFTLTTGSGGNQTGGNFGSIGGNGGNVAFNLGNGGATADGTAGTGGGITFTLGNGGAPTGSLNAGAGGGFVLTAGNAGLGSATVGAAGGSISLTAGNGSLAGAGGSINLTPGSGGSTGINGSIFANGTVVISSQANATAHDFDNSPTCNCIANTSSTAGNFAGDTGRDGVFSSAVYNGKIYISTSEPNASAVYRYDGANTWVQVSDSTDGKIVSGDTADIDASVLTVYNGKLIAGTQTGASTGAVYEYNGTTWTQITNATRGTFVTTTDTGIDGVSDFAVANGRLYAFTQELNDASVYRYEGGTTWTRITDSTRGKIISGDTDNIDAGDLVSYAGNLWASTRCGSTCNNAAVYRWDGAAWTLINTTRGQFASSTPNNDNVYDMIVHNNQLFITTGDDGTSYLNVHVYLGGSTSGAGATVFQRTNFADGQMVNGDSSQWRNGILYSYNGRLYAGIEDTNADDAALYEYTGGNIDTWTKIHVTEGSFGAQTNIDSITSMVELNGTLYVGTAESNAAGLYFWTKTLGNSNLIRFDSGSTNYGSIGFVGGQDAQGNLNQGGTFVFNHSISSISGAYDLAEDYPTRDESLQAGDIVSIDPYETGFVRKVTSAYDDTVLGVYSETPGFRLTQTDKSISGGRAIPIALVGRVPVKVSSENGTVQPGDALTSSSKPGVAMKATAPGTIVGKALEPYTNEDPNVVGKVLVAVKTGYWAPPLAEQIANSSLTLGNLSITTLTISDTLIIGDKITMDKDGKLTVNGEVIVAGKITLTGNLFISGKIDSKVVAAEEFKVKNTTNNPDATAGVATIISGTDELIINSSKIEDNSLVFVTPTKQTDKQFAVIEKITGTSFKVKLNAPATEDISFNWLIVGQQLSQGN